MVRAVDGRQGAVSRLGRRVAVDRREPVSRPAEPLIEPPGPTGGRQPPGHRRPCPVGLTGLHVGIGEKPVHLYGLKALGGMEHEDRCVPGEKRLRRGSACGPRAGRCERDDGYEHAADHGRIMAPFR
jgi:hypothetical protein